MGGVLIVKAFQTRWNSNNMCLHLSATKSVMQLLSELKCNKKYGYVGINLRISITNQNERFNGRFKIITENFTVFSGKCHGIIRHYTKSQCTRSNQTLMLILLSFAALFLISHNINTSSMSFTWASFLTLIYTWVLKHIWKFCLWHKWDSTALPICLTKLYVLIFNVKFYVCK